MRGAEKAVEQYIGTDIEVDIAAEGEVVVDIHVGIGIDDLAGLLGRWHTEFGTPQGLFGGGEIVHHICPSTLAVPGERKYWQLSVMPVSQPRRFYWFKYI